MKTDIKSEAVSMGFTSEAADVLANAHARTHTGGKWHANAILGNRIVGDASAESFDKIQINNHNATIATVYRRDDARLIAAAPDLLAALKLCAEKLAMWPEGSNPEFFPSLKDARKAIAKAGGAA